MKKGASFEWDDSYKNAFKSIKKYLSSPPALGAQIPGKPLILYIAAQESCKNAFKSIKKYLSSPPVLGSQIPGKPLILYIAAQERSLRASCAQENKEGKESTLYYLSRTLVRAKLLLSNRKKVFGSHVCCAKVEALHASSHGASYLQG